MRHQPRLIPFSVPSGRRPGHRLGPFPVTGTGHCWYKGQEQGEVRLLTRQADLEPRQEMSFSAPKLLDRVRPARSPARLLRDVTVGLVVIARPRAPTSWCLSCPRNGAQGAIWEGQTTPSPTSVWTLGFLASRTVRNKSLLFASFPAWHFVVASQGD